MLRVILMIVGLSSTTILAAQICSTPQEPLLERTDANKKLMIPVQRGLQKFIPITFHLVADANGNGRVTEEAVLAQVANINASYADQEAKFYIDRFNYFNNDAVYNDPGSTLARTQMRLRRDNNSVNVFIVNNIPAIGVGTTLAYYDPQEDWLVSRKTEINGGSSTLAHEAGHFFSLAHPFAGWDCHPFTLAEYTNPVNVDFTLPCDSGAGSALIELHDRSNCNTAGDRICDTPEDYNLGLFFQSGNCNSNTTIMDKNGELINPMTNNFMSYYSNCSTYEFTTTQKNLINTDFFSFPRTYIRTGVIPNTTPVVDPIQYITPINGEESNGITNILLDWEDTPGANAYLVVYDRFPSFTNNPEKQIVTSSEAIITNTLINGITYYWRVWPYNESMTGAGYSATQNFKVGTGTGVNEIKDINEYNLSPNPVTDQMSSLLTLSSQKPFEAQLELTNASGQIISLEKISVPSGVSQFPIQTTNLPAGIYFVILNSGTGRLVERLLLIE